MPFSTLRLEYAPEQRWLDFIVDGRPLSRFLELHGRFGAMGWLDARSEGRIARMLIGEIPSELPDGRVPLYICGHCGDLGCGYVSVALQKTAESFIWRDFSHSDGRLDGYEFHFERSAYLSIFRPRR